MGLKVSKLRRSKKKVKGKVCSECNKPTMTSYWNWCQNCNASHFRDNFPNWSSGNPSLDQLIQESQLQAECSEQIMEWIPFEKFKDIKFVAQGGLGEVFYAVWEDGQIYNWDADLNDWKRRGEHAVALKKVKKTESTSDDFLNELKSLHSITHLKVSFEVAHCLETIHNAGLIHGDFHSGNILMGKKYPMISDFGLSRVWYALTCTNIIGDRVDLETIRDFRDAENERIRMMDANNDGMFETGEFNRHRDAVYTSRLIPTMALAQNLENKMRREEVEDYINSQYNLINPSQADNTKSKIKIQYEQW
ncbi:7270_t:CDS:2 [Dentiscutata erythropus]|uniref:7270_t:CDS:1 n=1 Tax=Dentiscutata erythropus TaxID=1348616 RepID=A0A9N9BQH2_9GLOM|nr:7270_t:CDS:2 [Dentiscutata erythropus]